jgi:MFS family permease
MDGTRRFAFSSLLFLAMGAATFTASSLGILATFIIDDLSISRTELGAVLAVVNIAAALLSPIAGRATDRVGGKAAIVALFMIAGATFLLLGTAVGYVMLLVGALAGAFSQASANPATNKLIAEDVPAGKRGLITGVKQSGVQFGIFVGGVTVPSVALAIGWRGAYIVVATIPLVLALIALWVVPSRPHDVAVHRSDHRTRLPAAIWWLAGYGFLSGFSGAVTYLVPLFTEETLDLGPVAGGVAAAVIALVAVVGRILWSRYAEQSGSYRGPLLTMAGLSVVAAGLFLASSQVAAAFVWPAAIVIGLGSSSWNSVGMLAVMIEAGVAATGRASGIVLFGFLTGLGLGPPLFGRIVDVTGSYDVMWMLSAIAALAAGAVVITWGRSARRV